ncbi:MAG: ComEA family DNA-binding protein [bacterium]
MTILVLFNPSLLFCQETIEEKLLEEQAESSDQSELFEILSNLRNNPININEAEVEQLEVIPGLTSNLRQEIIRYRKQNGPFASIEELLMVPGMDREAYNSIREFVMVPNPKLPFLKTTKLNWRSRLSDRIDRPQGFENGTYESSSQKIYHRLKFTLREKIQGGFLLEKDSGESRWDDLRLYYISLDLTKNIFLLIGHYQLEIGQGLVMWGPYGFYKSADTVYPIKKRGQGLRGYLTVDENAAFWGGTVSLNWGPFQFISFASQSKLDATPVSDEEVSGIYNTGFHRNEKESDKKDLVKESILGGRIKYKNSRVFSIGATFYISSFDKLFNNPDLTRNRFKFRGKENYVWGLDWDWSMKNFKLFGEAAQSKSGGKAVIVGSLLNFSSIQIALLYRNYQRNFHNFHSFGFGDNNGTTQNEKGYYTGIFYKITPTTKLRAYYDIFTHPWRTFFKPLPVDGKEFFSQIEQKFGRQIQIIFRFREKYELETETFKDAFNRNKQEFVEERKSQWRLQLDYRVSSRVHLRGRFEFVRFIQNRFPQKDNKVEENGILLYQELRIQPKSNVRLFARLTYFDTDSFNSRIFQYENDLTGLVTNRALFGRGNRWYFLIKYKPLKNWQISLKYSETYRDDVSVIGTGPDQIDGNLDRRYGLQLEMKM